MSKIGVILPVYNGESFIIDSVNSILNQTFKDLTLYVLDDGSTDSTINLLNSLTDKRLIILKNQTNKGLIFTLNKGLSLKSNHKYLARMDADDISLPNRFQMQHDFLENHTNIGVLGTAMKKFGSGKGSSKKMYLPQSQISIASSFLFYNSIFHPTVMLRSSTFDGEFSVDYPKYEDYHLWIKMFNKTGFYNLKDILLKYRRHEDNVTGTYKKDPFNDYQIINSLLNIYSDEMSINLNEDEIRILSIISGKTRYEIDSELQIGHLRSIQSSIASKLNKYFDKEYFSYLFQERVALYFLYSKNYKPFMDAVYKMNFKHKGMLMNALYLKIRK